MAAVLIEDKIAIPAIESLADFRRWALSDDFPERGRIDYIAGQLEVDLSPEDFFTHGTLKAQLLAKVVNRVEELDIGHTLVSDTRISSVPADLSAEPDVVVVSHESLDDGSVRLTPKASCEEGRYVEVEGGPDLIVEVVSDSSVTKDTVRLPKAYYAAVVREYWLADARSEELFFQIYRRGDVGFEPTEVAADGTQQSAVLQIGCRLERTRHRRGHWAYRLALSEE